MKQNRKRIMNGLKQYIIKTEAEKQEVLWLIKEGVYKSIEHYIERMTKLVNGKTKDVNGRYINLNKLKDAALV